MYFKNKVRQGIKEEKNRVSKNFPLIENAQIDKVIGCENNVRALRDSIAN